jgi:Zn-dependent protease
MPDLSFSIFRIPVRVQLWFFALVFVLAGFWNFRDPASMFVFAGIVFASILVHELGHAFMGRLFGLQPSITIHGFGGLTSWTAGRNVGAGRSLLISLAGPAVGLFVGTALFLVSKAFPLDDRLPPLAMKLFWSAVSVNLFWSVFNLAPVMPLDGGNAFRSFWALTKIGDAEIVARVVSIPVALAMAAFFAFGWHDIFMSLFMLLYVGQNFTGIRVRRLVRGDQDIQKRLMENYPGWLASNDGDAMIREGTRARASAKTPHLVAYATEVVAMGQCLQGDARSALATLRAMPNGFAPSLDVALHVLDAAGEHATALELLRRAAEASRDPELLRRLEEARARMP